MHVRNNWVESKLGRFAKYKYFLHLQTANLRQLILNPYAVIHAAPCSCDAVDMVSLSVYADLYGAMSERQGVIIGIIAMP